MSHPWFRLYSEVLNDRKIQRAARVAGVERALAVGVWTGMLCLANDSPERGALYLAPDVPWTLEDVADEVGCDAGTLSGLMETFVDLNMIDVEDGVIYICQWDERQFESDSSTERVRRYRARKASATETPEEANNGVPVTLPVTPEDRYGNRSEQSRSRTEHSIDRAETEQRQSRAEAETFPPLPPDESEDTGVRRDPVKAAVFKAVEKTGLLLSPIMAERWGAVVEDYAGWLTPELVDVAFASAADAGVAHPSPRYIGAILDRWEREGHRPIAPGGNGARASPELRTIVIVDPDTGERVTKEVPG